MAVPAAGAFEELERAVRHLGEELAFFRRRALEAERRVRDLTQQVAAAESRAEQVAAAAERAARQPPSPAPVADARALTDDPAVRERLGTLEAENADLRDRLSEAAERTRALADRVRFVRQQVGQGLGGPAEEPA